MTPCLVSYDNHKRARKKTDAQKPHTGKEAGKAPPVEEDGGHLALLEHQRVLHHHVLNVQMLVAFAHRAAAQGRTRMGKIRLAETQHFIQ